MSKNTIYPEGLKPHGKPLYDKLYPFVQEVKELSLDYWSKNLSCLVIFGSYARAEVTLKSDLDLLIVVKNSDQSFRQRTLQFAEYLEKNLKSQVKLEISAFVFTEGELKDFHPLLIDVHKHHIVLYDNGFFKTILKRIDKLYKKGVFEERKLGDKTYWRIDYEKLGKRLSL